jgi:hypothetical protein
VPSSATAAVMVHQEDLDVDGFGGFKRMDAGLEKSVVERSSSVDVGELIISYKPLRN